MISVKNSVSRKIFKIWGCKMPGYETKALLLSILRFLQETSDIKKTQKLIEELLMADSYVPEVKKTIHDQKERPDPIRGA